MTSGAAPLSAEVLEMLKICFSNDSIQGVSGVTSGAVLQLHRTRCADEQFGMTETVGTTSKGYVLPLPIAMRDQQDLRGGVELTCTAFPGMSERSAPVARSSLAMISG